MEMTTIMLFVLHNDQDLVVVGQRTRAVPRMEMEEVEVMSRWLMRLWRIVHAMTTDSAWKSMATTTTDSLKKTMVVVDHDSLFYNKTETVHEEGRKQEGWIC